MALTEDDVLANVRKLRANAAARVERLDQAIEVLTRLDDPAEPEGRRGPSVRTRVLDLIEEGDREWTPDEVAAEFNRREVPLPVKDPKKQAQTALALLARDQLAVRVAPNRYRAACFAKDGHLEAVRAV